jgi:hypothetical protein
MDKAHKPSNPNIPSSELFRLDTINTVMLNAKVQNGYYQCPTLDTLQSQFCPPHNSSPLEPPERYPRIFFLVVQADVYQQVSPTRFCMHALFAVF